MHYTFDFISCIVFAASLFILWVKRWRFSRRHRAIYGLIAITAVYLPGALYFAFSYHARTGRMILKPFYAFDTFYFVTLSLVLGFLALYFADTCLTKAKHTARYIFPVPALMAFLFLINHRTEWMFSYEYGVYTRGPLLIINYIVWAVYAVGMLVMLYRARNRLGYRTVAGLLLFWAMEFAFQVYQFFVVEFYTGGIAFTTGLLYLVIAPLFLEPGRDELTGLYNRDGFAYQVREDLKNNPSGEYQIIAADVSGFKDINDRFGFLTGNTVLQKVADEIANLFPGVDTIARFDADRFFICAPKEEIHLPLPELSVEDVIPGQTTPYRITLFEGVYPVSDRNESLSVMFDRATFALDQVKRDYQKRFAYFDAVLDARMQFQHYITREMHSALLSGRFKVYYQPVFDLQTMQIVSAEALIRWQDEKYGMIPPGDFVPVFEKNGSVSELDAFVFETVCKQLTKWKEAYGTKIPISINMSRVDLLNPSFMEDFLNRSANCKLTADDLRIEITESAFVKMEQVASKVQQLHDRGYKILMDDFGNGYSNFNTFAEMPVDILKADMGFVASLDASERGQGVLLSITEMAKKLSMPVIVEGVETEKQLEQLKAIGVQYVQGYYLAKPMPAEEFEQYLKK
ncbi:MAG: EAL domain-containing protein [Lachnospiraceae bacterium]|nr:EAL domain-containing protein [Lachnospiraceae bacterium]